MRFLAPWILVGGAWIGSWNGVRAQSSSASWLFPLEDGTTVNNIDKIFLQWTSNYAEAWLNMWCQNGTAGNNVVLGSQFQVDATGRYGYVIADEAPSLKNFPVACHAQLAVTANGAGVDGPVGVTFSQAAKAAKTFSLTPTAISVPVTSTSNASPVSTPSSSVVKNTGSNSQAPIPTPTPTNSQSSSASTRSSSGTTAAPVSVSSFFTSSASSASSTTDSSTPGSTPGASADGPSSNNLGAIVGGVIGGLALLCFIIFGALFLRKYQRKNDDTAPKRTPSNSWWRRTYRTTEMQTAGLHEKDGDTVVRLEKDGNPRHEAEGDIPTRHEKEASILRNKRYTPIELPT